MALFTIEQTRAAYWADFAFFGVIIVVLALVLGIGAPDPVRATCACLAVAGVLLWSALEYLVHRFVFHGIQPFLRWHAEHHARPAALIGTPTVITATLLGGLLFLPTWAMGDFWCACSLTLGVLCGYFAYATMHHAIHHWRSTNAWFRRRQRWHFVHHRAPQSNCFGVTSSIWDTAFRSGRRQCASEPRDGEASRREARHTRGDDERSG